MDSPFYPITLYPKDIKTNLKEDPKGIYLLVRGAELKDFDSLYLQAKILLTKFFMNALSWGGNIVGGAYGYLIFDIDRYSGNLSTEEMKKIYGEKAAESKVLAGFADDSPMKVLTRGQLPPQPDGQLRFALNSIDANAMLSKKSEYYDHGDLGRDIAIDRNKIHDNQMVTDSIATWRAYISPFDQQGQYNTKAIASSAAEFAEVKDEKQVLPGRDLDHRELVLPAGENFFSERDRFDRVIDFFDGSVLLDGQGVHPTQAVKTVRLVKSVDPEGKRTKKEDFEIYDRPFTVYYTGEMVLTSGQRIALRPTQLVLTQRSTAPNLSLVNNRMNAFNQVVQQADFIKETVENLLPKLSDYQLVQFIHQLDGFVVKANQAVEAAKTEDELVIVSDAAIQEMIKLQEEVVTNHDLDSAIQRSASQQGQHQVDEAAYNTRLGIVDANELDQKTSKKYQQQVKDEKQAAILKLAAFANPSADDSDDSRSKRSAQSLQEYLTAVRQETQDSIRRIQNIYIPQAVRDDAVAELTNAATARKGNFAKVAFVDATSLKRQSDVVDTNVALYGRRIQNATTREEIENARMLIKWTDFMHRPLYNYPKTKKEIST
ncbi:hypothetical protein [Fructobacillus parabroussonetiae]|uniref:Uncharacterized protein n=1 Tax=Fructobacillus parabroussonetiae TaxID=2713174 RepID=A0ABS5QXG4_9LACO|nr:hypothetical protein [Fructobacillus parabroussonetiae]MBS9337885.1 hypothetical protein [Fructobacillus parabroussonetiae]